MRTCAAEVDFFEYLILFEDEDMCDDIICNEMSINKKYLRFTRSQTLPGKPTPIRANCLFIYYQSRTLLSFPYLWKHKAQ